MTKSFDGNQVQDNQFQCNLVQNKQVENKQVCDKQSDCNRFSSAVPVLVGSQFAIASAAIFAKFALSGAGPVMVAALRLTLAVLVLSAINRKKRASETVSRAHECLFALCGLALSVHFATWFAALNLTSVAIATLLVSTAPVWTTLYDMVFLRRRPSKLFWMGFVSTAIGTLLSVLSGKSGSAVHTTFQQFAGAALSLSGGVAFACYLIAVRSVSKKYSTLAIVNRTYFWSAVFLWFGVLLFGETLPAAKLSCWGGIVGMAIFSQLLGHTGINMSLKNFAPNVVALSTLLEPVFASVIAFFVFGEALTLWMIVGASLIVGGLVAVLSAQGLEENSEASALPEL